MWSDGKGSHELKLSWKGSLLIVTFSLFHPGSNCCLTPSELLFRYIMVRTIYFQNICFKLDQLTKLDFYSASSLEQQFTDKTQQGIQHTANLIQGKHSNQRY
jgi:hypothetical protein